MTQVHVDFTLPTNWPVRSKFGDWEMEKGITWYFVGKEIQKNNYIQDRTWSNLNKMFFMLGYWCYCPWNGKDQAPPAKIKQATTWRKCSFGDVILTLSLTWMINWVMNACYSFHRQLTFICLRIKIKLLYGMDVKNM